MAALHNYKIFNRYDKNGNMETSHIALAKPGKRLIGILNGVIQDTCRLDINLNNTWVLSFDVARIVNGEVSNYYDRICYHMELQLPGIGWFKINEEPTISGDGNSETMSIRAESLEIELAQYPLRGREINTGQVGSCEMLAVDNTYLTDDKTYWLAWDNVKFYRDTTQLEELIQHMKTTDGTKETLLSLVNDYPCIFNMWRLTYHLYKFTNIINQAIEDGEAFGRDMSDLQTYAGEIIKTQYAAFLLVRMFPELIPYIIQEDAISDIDLNIYDEQSYEITGQYTIPELLDIELQRQKGLSLLDYVLSDTDWHVKFVDDYTDSTTDNEDDAIMLSEKIMRFEIDSSNVYSFLTQEASQSFRCVFIFDTNDKSISVYNINNVGEDTNVFLSFHNIQNSIERTSDQQFATVFQVNGGDDLDITRANLGEYSIQDLSYFMNTDHFSQDTIDKYNYWVQHRENARKSYMDLSVQYMDQEDVVTDLEDRVPIDRVEPSQYESMSYEELLEEKSVNEAILRKIQTYYVNDDNEFDIDALMASDDYMEYLMIKDQILSDPLDALDHVSYDNVNKEYILPDEYRLGDIDIAIFNLWVLEGHYVDDQDDRDTRQAKTNYKLIKEYLEDYRYNFEKYGDAYGTKELEAIKQQLENDIKSLYAAGYSIEPDSPDDHLIRQYQKYQKTVDALEELNVVKAQRDQELADAQETLKNISDQMQELREDAAISNEQFHFTEEELDLIKLYYIETDYVNENSIITNSYTNQQIIDTIDELIKNAYDELYVYSHPQWRWNTTQDNLFLMPEFKDWHGDLDIGNYIHVCWREDDSKYIKNRWISLENNNQVKLRIISIGLNPFMIEPTIDLTFSSMLQYRSKRNDFVELLNLGTMAGNNQITATLGTNTSNSTFQVDSGFVMKLLQNGSFKRYVNSSASSATNNAYRAVSDNISALAAPAISNADIDISHIVQVDSEDIGEFDSIVANTMTANTGIFGVAMANVMSAQKGQFTTAIIDSLETNMADFNEAVIGSLKADTAEFDSVFTDMLTANHGEFDNLVANLLEGGDASFTGSVTATSGYIGGSSKSNAWEITSGKIETMYPVTTDGNTSNKYMGMAIDGTGQAFYANASTSGGIDGVFRVDHNGILTATGANINGTINATTLNCGNQLIWDGTDLVVDGNVYSGAGIIGGWNILDGCLYTSKDNKTVMLQRARKTADLIDNHDGSYTFIPGFDGEVTIYISYDGNLDGYQLIFSTTYPNNDLQTSAQYMIYHTPEEYEQAEKDGIILDEEVYYAFESADYGNDYSLQYDIDDPTTQFNFIMTMPNVENNVSYTINAELIKNGETVPLSTIVEDTDIISDSEEEIVSGFTSDTVFGVKVENNDTTTVPLYMTDSGYLYASNADISGNITADTLNCGNKLIWNGSDLSITGSVTATSGTIGGCNIVNGQLQITSISADAIDSGTINGIDIVGTNITGTSTVTGASISGGTITGSTISGGTISGATFNQVGGVDYQYVSADGQYSIGGVGMKSTTAISNGIMKADVVDTTNIISVDSTDNTIHSLSNFMVHGGITGTSGLDITGTATLRTVYLPTMWNTVAETDTPNLRVDSAGFMCRAPSSSIRYKNISDYLTNNDIDRLYDVPVYWFKYKDGYIADTDQRYDKDIPGFIVEDWEDIMPIAIDHNDDGSPEMWNSNIVVPLMFQMIKNDHEQIQELKNKIKELEDKLSN